MLVSYRGVVTSTDPLIPSVFTVDKKVKVCPSLLTGVCNIPLVRPGQAVTLHNSHLVKFKGVRWLGKGWKGQLGYNYFLIFLQFSAVRVTSRFMMILRI